MLLLTVSAHSCKEDKPTLPPETQTGKNTFGCYVNGVLFINDGAVGWGYTRLTAAYIHSYDRLQISCKSKNGTITLMVSNPEVNVKKTLSYAINENYQSENGGEIFLTRFDFEKRIVSGTFSYGNYITKGRFDISNMGIVIWE